ncbi:hypothetical protein, partial [Eggerthella lenta]|uniref:hypothetical protein n=1 Tax=Eggerthella lenta TaxID=84112 RepID=UPI001D098124
MNEVQKHNGIALIHSESAPYIDALIDEKISHGKTTPYDHMMSRPPLSEAMEVSNLLPMIELSGATTLF